jgi:hypothetical protein
MLDTGLDTFRLAFKGAADAIGGIIKPAFLIIEIAVFRFEKPV